MGKNNLNSYCFDFSFEKSKTIDEKELSDLLYIKQCYCIVSSV